MTLVQTQKKLLLLVKKNWDDASGILKTKIDKAILAGNKAAEKKFDKDTSTFSQETVPTEGVYIFNNRKQEASFGTLKAVNRQKMREIDNFEYESKN